MLNSIEVAALIRREIAEALRALAASSSGNVCTTGDLERR